MSNEENNVKAEGGQAAGEHIVIRVRDQTGEEVQFKVKPSTKMQKIFAAFAGRKGVQETSLRFFLDGERIQTTDTPESLGLESEDQIDVMLEQQGGAFAFGSSC